MSTIPGLFSVEMFEQLPDTDGVQELLDGTVVRVPPPKKRHSEVVRNVVRLLRKHISEELIWSETGFLIGRHCPQPDVAVIHLGQGSERGWFSGAPRIAIEVASRGNTAEDLEFKKDLYLANGAAEVWIVYDKTGSLMLHTATGTHRFESSFFSEVLGTNVDVREMLEAYHSK
jgi:Uma2 family endonuclease